MSVAIAIIHVESKPADPPAVVNSRQPETVRRPDFLKDFCILKSHTEVKLPRLLLPNLALRHCQRPCLQELAPSEVL